MENNPPRYIPFWNKRLNSYSKIVLDFRKPWSPGLSQTLVPWTPCPIPYSHKRLDSYSKIVLDRGGFETLVFLPIAHPPARKTLVFFQNQISAYIAV